MTIKRELKEYCCPWCNRKFERYVGYVKGQGNGKRSTVSDQVRCYGCGNLIPTWKKIHGVKIR